MPLKQINTTDQDLQLIQSNIQTALIPLDNLPMAGGVLITNVALISAQDNLIQHTLGRTPKIFIPVNLMVNSTIWSPTTSTLNGSNWNNQVINLRCSTSCTIALWIN